MAPVECSRSLYTNNPSIVYRLRNVSALVKNTIYIYRVMFPASEARGGWCNRLIFLPNLKLRHNISIAGKKWLWFGGKISECLAAKVVTSIVVWKKNYRGSQLQPSLPSSITCLTRVNVLTGGILCPQKGLG